MFSDSEGFLYPQIDSQICNDCGTCVRVCPILHLVEPNQLVHPKVYACWQKDDSVRYQSASGGAFSAFAESVLENGGVVYGAAFNNEMRVNHIAVHCKEELKRLRSSKYVQSDIGRTYEEVNNHLRERRKVLFSGTPCQIAALNAFCGKDNENLVTCDMLCQGVPSPGLFAKYVHYLEKRYRAKLVNINFRDKLYGWELVSAVAYFSDGRKYVLTGASKGCSNSFLYGFDNLLTLRSACYRCRYTNIDREGDVTLGDFWGIGNVAPFDHDTRNGISLVLVNSEKGRHLFAESSDKLYFEDRTIEEAKYKRMKLIRPSAEPKNRVQFFADYQQLEYKALANKHLKDKGLKGFVKRFVPRTLIFYVNKHIRKIR